jgi:hypothetical protein
LRFKEKMSDKGLHLFELQFEYFTVELLNAYYNIKIEERERKRYRERERERKREKERGEREREFLVNAGGFIKLQSED